MAQDTQDQLLSTKKTYLSPEGQRTGKKRQTQDIEDKGEGRGNKGEGAGVFFLEEGQTTASG